jgi:hypothetical protein
MCSLGGVLLRFIADQYAICPVAVVCALYVVLQQPRVMLAVRVSAAGRFLAVADDTSLRQRSVRAPQPMLLRSFACKCRNRAICRFNVVSFGWHSSDVAVRNNSRWISFGRSVQHATTPAPKRSRTFSSLSARPLRQVESSMLCAETAPPSFSHRERAPSRAVSGLSVGWAVFGMGIILVRTESSTAHARVHHQL